eukprot:2378103-Rhodomonas_salina.1
MALRPAATCGSSGLSGMTLALGPFKFNFAATWLWHIPRLVPRSRLAWCIFQSEQGRVQPGLLPPGL